MYRSVFAKMGEHLQRIIVAFLCAGVRQNSKQSVPITIHPQASEPLSMPTEKRSGNWSSTVQKRRTLAIGRILDALLINYPIIVA
jgi:hypothetical protein